MTDLSKASQEAVEAARQGEQFAMMLAAVQAAQVAQQPPQCHHQAPAPQQSGQAAKWIGIGVGSSIFLLAFALSAIAVAISAVSLTICVLILRQVWQDIRKGGK
jgi:cell division protein FtsL